MDKQSGESEEKEVMVEIRWGSKISFNNVTAAAYSSRQLSLSLKHCLN